MKTLLYLHGYNSSPQSFKAELTVSYIRKQFPTVDCLVPQLSYSPAQAIDDISRVLSRIDQPLLIGSSLGGYYANYLLEQYGGKAVLVNPAVYPDRLLREYLGPQKNDYTGEIYTLTEQHMLELRALAITKISKPKDRLLLVQTDDETLDFSEATEYYRACKSVIEYGGDHSFLGFSRWLPAIADFLQL